mmetsp:Transcript_12483/g.20738  ORF Transcript_12483/g.20738 Transcript_12483/m.20738 type:complete len:251 (-) Transcript_12483:86-838(-)|eukprot:CAMPEP_0119014102 /NCGR_PEP_ID=MMETSP1176-20130426/9355_1 /TAXON_ID=265551 /ORGANISM="Synedropsis recta cf, Strain CCMP1620" /LENGTH=250 /DNA_ID=CAMNT_0006967241 /DNA_START=173 /DNA_END=925 /DNA_ORIENTATION=+
MSTINNNCNEDQNAGTSSSVESNNTLGCFSCVAACPLPRWNNNDKEEVKQRMEEERHEGQALLRSMVTTDDKVDWQAIIKKAEELHSREQELLQQQTGQERRLFVQRQRKALQKRRKFDSIGSFSINLLTYRMEASEEQKPLSEASEGSTRDDENSLESQSPPASPKAPLVVSSSPKDNGSDKTSMIVDDGSTTPIEEQQQGDDAHPDPPSLPPMIFIRSTSSDLFIIDDQLRRDAMFVMGDEDVEFGSV